MNINKLLVYFILLVAGLFVSFFATSSHFDLKTISFLIFFLVFLPTLINTDIGLIIIIVSMLFSPDIILGQTSAREITVRIEDIFLLVVLLASFIKAALTKDLSRVFKSNLTLPFFLYIGVCILSTVFTAVFSHGYIDLEYAFFSILKYFEYFLFFLIAKANLRSLRQSKIFVVVFLLVALTVSIFANAYIERMYAAGGTFFRTAPPVETRGVGQAGTLGGYLIFMIAIAGGLLLSMRPLAIRIFLIALLALMFRAYLYTLSRGSYLAFIPMVFSLFLLTRKIPLLCVLIIISVVLSPFLPSMVRQRILTTATPKEGIAGPYIELDESPRDRLVSWQLVLTKRFPASPLLGHGVGKYFIDGQIFTTLNEVGLLGFLLFVWILVRLFKMAVDVFKLELIKNNEFTSGLSVGFLAGFIGLLTQALSVNTFIIIRIMEPFWFMAAIALMLPEIMASEQTRTIARF